MPYRQAQKNLKKNTELSSTARPARLPHRRFQSGARHYLTRSARWHGMWRGMWWGGEGGVGTGWDGVEVECNEIVPTTAPSCSAVGDAIRLPGGLVTLMAGVRAMAASEAWISAQLVPVGPRAMVAMVRQVKVLKNMRTGVEAASLC